MNENPEALRWDMGDESSPPYPHPDGDWVRYEDYERLRAEVLAEREECAKLCDDLGDGFPLGSDELHITKSLARDIRARGET